MQAFLAKVIPLDAVLSPSGRFFALYLLATFVLALTIMLVRSKSGDQYSIRSAIRAVLRRDVLLHKSALLDYRLAFCNHLLSAFVVGYGLLSIATVSGWTADGIARLLGTRGGAGDADPLAIVIYTVVIVLAHDLGSYVEHRLQHAVPTLWEFHKVHHSAEVLTPITALRIHPLMALFGSTIIAAFVGSASGIFLYLYDGKIAAVTFLGANALLVLHYTIGAYHLQHSHIWFVFPGPLKRHLISPALHMIHHSRNPQHYGKNFGFIFTWWDRLGGSFYVPNPAEHRGLTLGLEEDQQRHFGTLAQLYLTPFRNAARMIARRQVKREPAA